MELWGLYTPFNDGADALKMECEERAVRDDVNLADRASLHRWCMARYEEGDEDLRGLIDAQTAMGAIARNTNLHEPLIASYGDRLSDLLLDQDLVDTDIVFTFLDRQTKTCLAHAEQDGVDVDDDAALLSWLRKRYDVGDREVRDGLDCYLVGDAAQDLLKLTNPWRKDVIDGFANEIRCEKRKNCQARDYVPDEIWDFYHGLIGTFTSGAATYEVRVCLEEPYETPHFHVRRLRAPRIADVCVAIHAPEYVPHGPDRRTLNSLEVGDLIAFLKETKAGWLTMSNWHEIAFCWDDYRGEDHYPDKDYYAAMAMPDYTKLSWPEEAN